MNNTQIPINWWSSLKNTAQTLLGLTPLLSAYSYPNTTTPSLPCTNASFTPFLPSNAYITSISLLPQNSTFSSPSPPYPVPITSLPPLCALTITITTSPTPSSNFGLFLPSTWNTRLLTSGNGGFGGGINYPDMSVSVRAGFAALSTDTGHTSPIPDASWALGNPETQVDWGHRALHLSVDLAKVITRRYYGIPIRTSIFSGCSTGGRQGLKAIQLYPGDFDGVVVGAPAWWTGRLQPWHLRVSLWNLPVTAPYHIPSHLFEAIGEEVMRQCDGQDGVVDGIVSTPETCIFQPEELLCTATEGGKGGNGKCLSLEQLRTYERIYSSWMETGSKLVFPGHSFGSELEFGRFISAVEGGVPHTMGTTWLENFLLNHTTPITSSESYAFWSSAENFNLSTVLLGDTLNPGNANADDFDMSAFAKRGGKLMHWHGYADGLIPIGSSTYFHSQVTRKWIGMVKGDEVENWYRYFKVPGLMHCRGGAGSAPWFFGGAGQEAGLVERARGMGGCEDTRENVVRAVVRWVEDGIAPEDIVVRSIEREEGTSRRRLVCRWPLVARWDGVGDFDKEESWACRTLY